MKCFKEPLFPKCSDEKVQTVALIANNLNSKVAGIEATYMSAILSVDPFSNEGTDWLKESRIRLEALETAKMLKGYQVVITDGAGVEYDAVEEVYSVFPFMIASTLLVVFCLMGFFFKSVVVPIRSVFSIMLTLGFVYGLTVLVYQDGILR